MKALNLLTALALATFTSMNVSAMEIDPGPDDTATVENQQGPNEPGEDGVDLNPVSLNEQTVQRLNVYPNPSIGSEFTMDIPLNDDEPIALFVYDNNGRLVERKAGTYGELREFRFRHLDEASYIVRVFAEDAMFQARLIVAHR